jgi:signal transduction histidine kinase
LASLGTGSRELATELNTIIGFSRLILKEADGPLTELQRSDLSAIYKSGYKLLGLIDNVVTLSELDAGSFESVQQRVDMGGLLQEVAAMAQQRLVGTEIEYRQDGRWTVLGDESLLRQALLSLLVHAAEQVPRDRVLVRLEQDPQESGWLSVTMGGQMTETDVPSSNGVGMSGDEVEEMGVGLALARRIISLHQGQASFQFDVEGGLNVAVALETV